MENEEGICCIGAPIFDHAGEAIAALSVSGPAHRMPSSQLRELANPVMNTAQSISHKLGYLPSPPDPAMRRKETT